MSFSRKVSGYCRCLAHNMLIQPDSPEKWIPYVRSLLLYSGGEGRLLYPSWIPDKDFGADLSSNKAVTRTVLLSMAQAYSLLYTELTYEKLNMQTSVGLLVYAAVCGAKAKETRNLGPEIRKLWKRIQ